MSRRIIIDRVLCGLVLVAGCLVSEAAWAEETAATGAPAADAPASAATAPSADVTPIASGDESMVDNSWFSVGWPKVQMPKFSWKPWKGMEKVLPQKPKENPVSSALDQVASSSKHAADSVRTAWGSAVNKISSFGSDPKNEAIAKSDSPGFFSRFFGATEETKTPQTVSEFLAQERGKTTLK